MLVTNGKPLFDVLAAEGETETPTRCERFLNMRKRCSNKKLLQDLLLFRIGRRHQTKLKDLITDDCSYSSVRHYIPIFINAGLVVLERHGVCKKPLLTKMGRAQLKQLTVRHSLPPENGVQLSLSLR